LAESWLAAWLAHCIAKKEIEGGYMKLKRTENRSSGVFM